MSLAREDAIEYETVTNAFQLQIQDRSGQFHLP